MELTKRDMYNAKNGSNKLENGLEITLVGVGKYTDTNTNGEEVEVTVLKAENGDIYTTISNTVGASIEMLSDILADEGKADVIVKTKKSASGRDYFQLVLK